MKVSKFVKFYELLCDAVAPLMLITILPALALLVKVFMGYALVDIEFYSMNASIALSYAVFFTWLICSLVRRHQLNKNVKHPDEV